MYRYLNICGDLQFSVFEPVTKIRGILENHANLVRRSDRVFESAPDTPWISVGIVNCDSSGNHPCGLSQITDDANLVEIICPDDGAAGTGDYYMQMATELAAGLGWIVTCDGPYCMPGRNAPLPCNS